MEKIFHRSQVPNINTWVSTKNEVRKILIEIARSGQPPILYGALVTQIKILNFYHHAPALSVLLKELSIEGYKSGEGMLSTLVVNKRASLPGPGFFNDLQKELCIEIKDKGAFWETELAKVYQYYTDH